MKTRTNSFLKALFLVFLVPTMMISCGKKNKSGASSSSTGIGTDPWIGTNVNSSTANIALPGDWLNRLYNEYPCRNYYNNGANTTARTTINVQAPGPYQVNAGALYAGVTLEGDILIISNQNNSISAQVHACNRPGLTNTAQYIKKPVLNISENCAMGEITAADILLDSQNGVYHLAFFPAGMSARTTLCR